MCHLQISMDWNQYGIHTAGQQCSRSMLHGYGGLVIVSKQPVTVPYYHWWMASATRWGRRRLPRQSVDRHAALPRRWLCCSLLVCANGHQTDERENQKREWPTFHHTA